MNDCLIIWSTIVSAIATVGIFIFTILNYLIYRQTVMDQEKNEQRFADLLQAIVVSNMTQGSGGAVSISIDNFKRYYSGQTKVF
jgi:hypothetical protein